jgi:hypothetical protein
MALLASFMKWFGLTASDFLHSIEAHR